MLLPGGRRRRQSVEVDETLFANLLADQDVLRLVVLNSCEGARTTLTDPFAGVATTLIHLGVPAVVAMQFEISDEAAILFAEELYTNLIGRQDPIDAAVAEARKAIYSEVDKVEWATPVLFVRDPDVELFRFEVDKAELPPPPPPDRRLTPTTTPHRRRPTAVRDCCARPSLAVAAIVGVLAVGLAVRAVVDRRRPGRRPDHDDRRPRRSPRRRCRGRRSASAPRARSSR